MPPLVSVVIANHNYGRYLGDCIDSVLAQTYPRIETIVVDDGSTDISLEVLRSYGKRIAVISQSNKGPSAARNVGIARSAGKWIAFIDSDDTWLPEKLQEQSEYFRDDKVGIIMCGVKCVDASGIALEYLKPNFGKDPLCELVTFNYRSIGASTAVVRADCLRRRGGFDETLRGCEDLDLWIRIIAEYEVRVSPSALVQYRRHSGSLSGDVRIFEANNSQMLRKVFSDPANGRIHHLRREAFGRFYMILAGSYCHDGNVRKAARCALKAILYSPVEIAYLCKFPIRALRRLMASSESPGDVE